MILHCAIANNTQKDARLIAESARAWYEARDVFLREGVAPHIHITFNDGTFNGGGAGGMGSKRDTDNGWYPITITLGERYNAVHTVDYGEPAENLIHEIMHCLYFQFIPDYDIHSFGAQGNEKAIEYFFAHAPLVNKPNKVIIHHTASKIWTYKDVLEFHTGKWGDIGYHYFIEKNGMIKRGRWHEAEGYHTIGQNTSSIGICLAGDFSNELPTKEQEDALRSLVKELNYNDIKPHRAYAQTECYGAKLADDWVAKLIKPMYTLYKDPLKTSEIYAFGNNYKRHIASLYTIRKGKGKEWEYENEGTIPFADITLFANTPEAEEICFLTPDSQV